MIDIVYVCIFIRKGIENEGAELNKYVYLLFLIIS